MKCSVLIVFISLINFLVSYSQSRSELEVKRQKALEEINYVDNLLQSTTKEKIDNLNDIKIIGRKLDLRENVINGMKEEMKLVIQRIDLNNTAIDVMSDDLIRLKKDYAVAVKNSYKLKKGYPEVIYLLSAKDFNQGYKRLKYLQQVTKYRRQEAEVIVELKNQVEDSKKRLERDFKKLGELRSREEQQRRFLEEEQGKKQQMVRSLSSKEKQLQKELEEKKRIAKRIESEINRLIEEERKRTIKKETTPEQKLIGESFSENAGRLPWPVEKGIITSHFGVHPHPVFKYLTEDNIGIEITSSGKTDARSVFQGEVAKVFAIQGANMTVIIRHGKYLSVYANLAIVNVKPGDKVNAKQLIGTVYLDANKGNSSVLKFMIFDSEKKYLDPENWIARN
jgi:murein hydrolase activator